MSESQPGKTVSCKPTLTARFERLPFTRYQIKLGAILTTCFAADAVDLVMLSYLLAPISHDLNLNASEEGLAGISVFIGVGIGATVAGFLSDRFGRRQVLAYTMILWGVASLLTAFSWDIWSFVIFRFITGLGLGAEFPVAFALVAEFMPSTRRAIVTGWMHVASQAAAVLFNLLSFAIVSAVGGMLGWRAMFAVMFLVAVLALYVRRNLPESPRWYEARGQQDKAEAAMSNFEKSVEAAWGKPLTEPITDIKSKPETESHGGFRDLFSDGYTKRTLFVWAFWFFVLMAFYGISVWVGKFLVDRGMSVATSIGIGATVTLAGVPAAWLTGYLLEKVGRKPVFSLSLLCLAVAAFGYGQASSFNMVIVAGAAMHFFQVAVATALYAYTLELFPTRVRATGLGTASTVGRVAAVSGPMLVLPIVHVWGFAGAFIAFAGCLVFSAALIVLFGPETRDRSIDEISV